MGNDVVFLQDPRCVGKSRDLRFLKRVLTASEAAWVLGEPNADEALWLCWAVKESAFKVISKLSEEPPVFAHRSFSVTVDPLAAHGRHSFDIGGKVDYQGFTMPFEASVSPRRVHALAWSSADPARTPDDVAIQIGEVAVGRGSDRLDTGLQPFQLLLNERFSFRERRSIHSPPSAYVRLFARQAIAGALDIDERRLEIVCGHEPTGRVPPVLMLDGSEGPVDVSLSHHAPLVTWAFTIAEGFVPAASR